MPVPKARHPRRSSPEQAAQLPNTPTLNDEQRARKVALLFTFKAFASGSGILPDYEPQPHDEMCDELQQFVPELRVGKRQKKGVYLAPRYTYKTTLLIAFMVYLILLFREQGLDVAIDYVRATAELSKDVLYELKMILQSNETILELWGDLSESAHLWSESKVNLGTRRDATVNVTGLDFGASGKHPDIVIFDDLVNDNNYESIKSRRAARRKIGEYSPILPMWGVMIDSGTRYADNDVHGWILDQNESARRKCERLKEDGDPSWERYKPQWREYVRSCRSPSGDLFFPSRLTEDFLDQQQQSMEPKLFAANYLNSAQVEGMRRFRIEYLRYFTAAFSRYPTPTIAIIMDDRTTGRAVTLEEFPVRVTMTIDPTLTAQSTSDWTGMTVVATDAQDVWWVLKAIRLQKVPSEVGEEALKVIRQFMPSVCLIESAMADVEMMDRISKGILSEKLPTVIRSYNPLRDETAQRGRRKKAARIEALEPRFRNGRIWLHRQTCEALYDQYKSWPDVDHDDVLDALAMQYTVAKRCRFATLVDAETEALAEQSDEREGAEDIMASANLTLYDRNGQAFEMSYQLRESEPTRQIGGRAGMAGPRRKAS